MKKGSLITLVSLMAASLLFVAPSLEHRATACSCAVSREPAEALKESTAVFVGRVSSIVMDDALTDGAIFEVHKAWKGIESDASSIEIEIRGAGECSYGFQEGEEYLVYAYGDQGKLSTSICSRTSTLESAQADLAALGPSTVTFLDADAAEEKVKFSIWPYESEISDSWHTTIRTQLCPNPDFQEIETSGFLDSSDLTVSYIATRSDGISTPLFIENLGGGNDFCNGSAGFHFEPDSAGLWSILANATWTSSDGSNHTLQNETVVLAKPAIYTASSSEIQVDIDLQAYDSLRLLDWSSDGKSILVAYRSWPEFDESRGPQTLEEQEGKTHLGFLDLYDWSVDKIDMPLDFIYIYDARFSPSSDTTFMLTGRNGETELESGLFIFSVESKLLHRIADSIDDVVWMPDMTDDGQDDFVIGKTLAEEDGGKIFELWRTDSGANPVEKLFSKRLDDREGFQVHDSTKDGRKILMTDSESLGVSTVYKLAVFDAETKQFESTLSFGSGNGVRFTPSGELIIYNVGFGHRTPGGPLIATTLDGSYVERISSGERLGTYDSPEDYVISPDGRTIIAKVAQWGGGSYLTKNEFAHAMPEFEPLYVFGLSAGILCAYFAIHRVSPMNRPNDTNRF